MIFPYGLNDEFINRKSNYYMKNKKHLPLLGAGPVYVILTSIVTLVAITLDCKGIIPAIRIPDVLAGVMKVIAVLLGIEGISIWISAVFISRLTQHIKENKLVTNGVYGIVRHPIYAAFTLVEWSILMWTGNLLIFVLIPLYWAFFTILIKKTEEKWLLNLYGKEYEDYCKRVNRCIPWFPKKKRI